MAQITVTKGRIGVEDVTWWEEGSATFTRTTSDGGTQTLNAISAADVPVEDLAAVSGFIGSDVDAVLKELNKSATAKGSSAAAYTGGTLWAELATAGTTKVVIDSTRDYRDRWLVVKLLYVRRAVDTDVFRPGGDADDVLDMRFDPVERACYTKGGRDETGGDWPGVVFYLPEAYAHLPRIATVMNISVGGNTGDSDFLDVVIDPERHFQEDNGHIVKLFVYADSGNGGALTCQLSADYGHEYVVALKIDYSPDQGQV